MHLLLHVSNPMMVQLFSVYKRCTGPHSVVVDYCYPFRLQCLRTKYLHISCHPLRRCIESSIVITRQNPLLRKTLLKFWWVRCWSRGSPVDGPYTDSCSICYIIYSIYISEGANVFCHPGRISVQAAWYYKLISCNNWIAIAIKSQKLTT